MNKATLITVVIVGVILFAGIWVKLNSDTKESKKADSSATGGKTAEVTGVLIACFSHTGNTRIVAQQIQKETGAAIFEIQPVDSYPQDYKTCADQAKKEINSNFKPKLKSNGENIDSYDVIFIGSPNWWNTIAPPVATFLSGSDMKGKTIIPFMTHGGTGLGNSVADIKILCPESTVHDGLAIKASDIKKSQKEIAKWLKEISTKNRIEWK